MPTYGHWFSKTEAVHLTVQILTADEVTDEVLEVAREVEEGWFGDEDKIDWESFFDRMDGTELAEHGGREIDMGSVWDTPAQRKIQKYIRELRNMG